MCAKYRDPETGELRFNAETEAAFKQDRKLLQKRHRDMNRLSEVMSLLINEKPLHGIHQGKWECHVEPDWLLIYRTGTHSDLF